MISVSVAPLLVVGDAALWLVVQPDQIPAFIKFLPKLVYILAALKLVAIFPVVIRLVRSDLVPVILVKRWIGCCAVAGFALFAIASCAIPSSAYSRGAIAAQVFLLLPLVRIALAPLFVHRGRHG